MEGFMSGVLMQIQISTDGSIKVVDAEGKALYPLNPEEFSAKLPGKTIKMAELCSILYTNPCAWVYVNGQSYYRCD